MMNITSISTSITPPSSPPTTRLRNKLQVNSIIPENHLVNWSEERCFTPGLAVGYRNHLGLHHVNGNIQLFHAGQSSQGLIFENNQVVAASVTTSIKTITKRDKETKSTYVQYDKARFNQEGCDFPVVEENKRKQINYQGGHLIDHKFSAENSHTTNENYFPQHCIVNAPLKEYVVKRAEAYIEILLHTGCAPTVGLKNNKAVCHQIPIGDILIVINQNTISDIYFFPNNAFDYEKLTAQLKIKKNIAANLLPYFKLKPCFHALLQSAILTDFRCIAQGKERQKAVEEKFFDTMDSLSEGMSLAICNSNASDISQLAFKVLHKEGNIDPILLYNTPMPSQCQDPELSLPLKTLGEFLVNYSLRNALKSEVISTKSRLIFLDVIIDFIEAPKEVSSSALDFAISLAPEFKETLEELQKIQDTMTLEELFYFSDIYRRLSSEENLELSLEGPHFNCLYPEDYIEPFFNLLKQITQKYNIQEFNEDEADEFLSQLVEADERIGYWIEEQGNPQDEFEKQINFLKFSRGPCLELLKKFPNLQYELDDLGIFIED